MRADDYERALTVLERCVASESVERLGEELLESLGSVYGCVHTAFFRTGAFTRTVADPDPVMNGRIPRIIDEYRERWYTQDVMYTSESIERIRRSGVSSLTQLQPRRLPAPAAAYLDRFIYRHGLHSVCALDLDLPAGQRGVVGIFHEQSDSLSAADLAGFGIVVRQLSPMARLLPVASVADRADALGRLTPRLREVADLVGQGSTNTAVARRTGLDARHRQEVRQPDPRADRLSQSHRTGATDRRPHRRRRCAPLMTPRPRATSTGSPPSCQTASRYSCGY